MYTFIVCGAIITKIVHIYVLIVAAVRRVVASSSLTQSLKGIATAGIIRNTVYVIKPAKIDHLSRKKCQFLSALIIA